MKFEKVSYEQYRKDSEKDFFYSKGMNYFIVAPNTEGRYNNINLPARATKKSAGYDFFSPHSFTLDPGDTIKLATGVRVILDDDKFLMCCPRSSHGFKARLQMDNTIGIIDADYADSDNEGHIHVKLTNDSNSGAQIHVEAGDKLFQAIILPYFTVEDDNVENVRNGGFGSTDKK